MILLMETGQLGDVTLVAAAGTPLDASRMPVAQNPLGKIPALERPDGPALYDSRVICRYLDARAGAGFYPAAPRLWDTMRLEATGDGICDAALLMVCESRVRPEERRMPDWVEAQWAKVSRAIYRLERSWISHLNGSLDIGHGTGGGGHRTGRPRFSSWCAQPARRAARSGGVGSEIRRPRQRKDHGATGRMTCHQTGHTQPVPQDGVQVAACAAVPHKIVWLPEPRDSPGSKDRFQSAGFCLATTAIPQPLRPNVRWTPCILKAKQPRRAGIGQPVPLTDWPVFRPLKGVHQMSHADGLEGTRRDFLYYATAGAGAVATGAAVWPLVNQMSPSADVQALASINVDVSGVEVGTQLTVKWRGKPVFIRRRSAADIATAREVPLADLADQNAENENLPAEATAADENRSLDAAGEWLVMMGVCTHLGCVPLGDGAGEFGGWFCPCHGSHYDTAGRIRKGPAPRNLPVPVAVFDSETVIKLG